MRTALTWVWFAVIQVISLIAMVIGWVLLIPFCLTRSWEVCASPLDPTRTIDRWRWKPMNSVFGNPEDGVSGNGALIWNESGMRVPYMPDAWDPWRAYLWSAWRNSADNLKYVFRWTGGPFRRWERSEYYFQLGWNASGFPVISAGRK